MGADDFQVLLAPDGRYAVLQGDPLLLELEALDVPKRERPAIALAAAGRRTAGGYLVECAIPFAALGVTPRAGADLAIDLGLNDWLADHSLAGQLHFDLETLRKLDQRATRPPVEYTENSLEADSAAELERRFYRPWSLSGTAISAIRRAGSRRPSPAGRSSPNAGSRRSVPAERSPAGRSPPSRSSSG